MKILDVDRAGAILIVPPEGRELLRLAQVHRPALDGQKLVLDTALRGGDSRGVRDGPLVGPAHEVRGELADQHRRGLEVDPLVLGAHDERPRGVGGEDGELVVAVDDDVTHAVIHALAVPDDVDEGRPLHLVLGEVVPRHLVHARLHDLLKPVVDTVGEEPSHPQLVDVDDSDVPEIEHERVAQLVPRRAGEGVLAQEAGEENLSEGPGVLEVVEESLPCARCRDVREGDRGHGPVLLDARACSADRSGARPP
mmetsp:Transcript_31494/g.61465  ORF Transcript_31494/g.61465 Transcript_31494/m.61465 type:complete len:253 (+) Transcript_31494:1581-2339(+)